MLVKTVTTLSFWKLKCIIAKDLLLVLLIIIIIIIISSSSSSSSSSQ